VARLIILCPAEQSSVWKEFKKKVLGKYQFHWT